MISRIKYCMFLASLVMATGASATPLSFGTPMRIHPGNSTYSACTVGSCFVMGVAPGFPVWTNFGPGTDGGIIVGKNQGIGEISAEAFFFGTWTHFVTAAQPDTPCASDASANLFDDAGCSGSACAGKTQVGTFHFVFQNTCSNFGGVPVSNYVYDIFRGVWQVDFGGVVADGPFQGAVYRVILAGPTGLIIDPIPEAQDLSITLLQNTSVSWTPLVSIAGGYSLSCSIATPAQYGSAYVNPDCSSGGYIPHIGFIGGDSFVYEAFGGMGSDTGTVTVTVTPGDSCRARTPIAVISTDGGGQSADVNATLGMTFIGHIVGSTATSVTICPGTRLEFQAHSSAGEALCRANNILVGADGYAEPGDRLICSNKPTGEDVDRYRIRAP